MNLMPGILTVTLCRECDTPIAVKQTQCREGCEYWGIGYSKRPIAHHRYEVKLIEVIHEGPKRDALAKLK